MQVTASETTYLCENKTVDSDTSLRTFESSVSIHLDQIQISYTSL